MNENTAAELGRLSSGSHDHRWPAAAHLKLPRGAFIALRQSGGLSFSTRAVTVYHDGRVVSQSQGKLNVGTGSRRITPDEVAEIKNLIEHGGLRELSNPIGQPSPDGYAYKLIARFGRKLKLIEFFDGSIPAELQPLLTRLKLLVNPTNTQE